MRQLVWRATLVSLAACIVLVLAVACAPPAEEEEGLAEELHLYNWSEYIEPQVLEDFEAEFVRIFDAGPGGPPCPLYEGKYAADRMVNMESLVRFYNHFGLSVAEAKEREMPDHITTELEFMHYLAFKEVLALQRDEEPSPYCFAEIDFLNRHVAKWLPKLLEKTEKVSNANLPNLCEPALSFYRSLIGLSAHFCENDLKHLRTLYPDRE